MASGSLLALIDDIAAILDDVALMSKVAAKKTAGVLGDDLALNAQQVSGVNADRDRPHHRQFAVRVHAGYLLGVQCEVVAEHAGGLLGGDLAHQRNVIQDRRDVVD